MYGAALFRLRKEDFDGYAHYDGMSPKWPVSYEDFEPYYTQAEHMYQVHGIRGEDPTDPWASAPYPHPPVSHEPRIQQLSDDLAKAGFRPFHTPAESCWMRRICRQQLRSMQGLRRLPLPRDGQVGCGDLRRAPRAAASNVTLITHAMVFKLNTNAAGTAVTAEVVADVDGTHTTFRGGIVVVASGAANSAKLLLMSANDKHPNGLAQRVGPVGRNYMFHTSQAVLAISKEPNPTKYQKTLG